MYIIYFIRILSYIFECIIKFRLDIIYITIIYKNIILDF